MHACIAQLATGPNGPPTACMCRRSPPTPCRGTRASRLPINTRAQSLAGGCVCVEGGHESMPATTACPCSLARSSTTTTTTTTPGARRLVAPPRPAASRSTATGREQQPPRPPLPPPPPPPQARTQPPSPASRPRTRAWPIASAAAHVPVREPPRPPSRRRRLGQTPRVAQREQPPAPPPSARLA